ncbi:hypothetical protein [Phytohabitans houttuyneae]|uniref:Uncharacterized protein n=1 Tax=Phytohabitans houttuyneae TaxID=1076126 RepID=A0A6V8K6T6_9ACTN|nr:hypothetical protein [Phytohabitans houttuyneae]GFJ79474.1 hypothetical protein Phou_036540 [Phytohabitans houttuyneae]
MSVARRRIAVEFVAEMLRFHRDMQSGADDVRRLKDESRAAQLEVAKLGTESQRASAQVAQSARQAASSMAGARAEFGRAGSAAGREFGDAFTRDASGRLRTADGRFATEGARLGGSLGRGISRGVVPGLSGISGRPLLLLAAGGVAAVGALQGVPPVLAAIGGGLGAIPGLAAGASAALATLGVGLSGVGGAIGEVFDPPAGGGGGGGGIDQTAGALRRLEQAERALRYAQRDARESQVALNRAREQATRDLRDMALQLKGTRLDERSATIAVLEAERDLREVRARGGDPLEVERAQLAYEQAQHAVEETRNRLQDLTVDQGKAAKAGVEGSDTVQQALRDQERAYDAVKDAQYGVLDAQEALAAAQAGGGGGGAAAATAYDKLSKNAKKFVDAIRAQKTEIEGLRHLAQDRIFAGLDREFTQTFTQTLPFARKQIIRFGDDWNTTFKNLLRLGRDDQFLAGLDDALAASDRFFDNVNKRIPATGRTLSHLFTGSVPFIDRFGDTLLSYVDDFNDFIDRAAQDGSLEEFFEDAADQAEALLDIGREVIELVGRIGGMDQGSTLLRDMADALEKFNDEAHDMRSVEGIIATGNAAVKGLVEVLLVLGETLGETLADEGTRDAVILFFDILKVGAQIVGNLAQLFSALPDPIQSVVLAGAALFLVGSKIFGLFDRLGGILGRANGQLGHMGPMGAQAAAGLERVGRAAKAAGIALAAMQIGAILLDQFSDAEVKVSALSRALEEYGKTGKRTGELQRTFGRDTEDTRKIYSAAASGWAQDTARFAESIPIWGDLQRGFSETFHGQSFSGAKENVAQLDAELTNFLNTSEDVTAAQAAYNNEFYRSGLSFEEFKALLPESTAAMEKLASGVGGANLSQRLLNGSMEDAIEITGSYTDAWKALHGEMLSADEAALRAAEAIDAVGESFSENGRAIDGNSKAALENRIAVQRAAEQGAALAQQKYQETGSVQQASRAYNQHIAALREELRQAGLTKAQIDTLIKRYTTMPPLNVDSNLDTMRREAERYNAALDRIRRNVKAGGFGVNGNFVGIGGNRWGGVYEHAQIGKLREAHIAAAHPVARYAYAERATGGEAFIPRYGHRARAVSIGQRAMGWHGMDVVPKGALAAAYGQAMSLPPSLIPVPAAPHGPIVLEIRSSGSSEDELLLERLRRAVRVRGGDVQIVIGTS